MPPKISLLHTGVDSSTKPISCSIWCGQIDHIQPNWHMRLSMALYTFNQHPWHHQEQSVWCTSNLISNNLGEYMQTMVFTLDQPSSIINAIKLPCNKPISKESLIPFYFDIISHCLQYQPMIASSLPSNSHKMPSPNIQLWRPPMINSHRHPTGITYCTLNNTSTCSNNIGP